MFKKFISFICLFALVVCLVPVINVTEVSAASFTEIPQKERPMYDNEFFGEWDGESWTIEPKLNYADFPELAAVEEAAKAGDYQLAKEEYLLYYRSNPPRFERKAEYSKLPNNTEKIVADMFLEGIVCLNCPPRGYATFTNTDSWVTFDITQYVVNMLSTNNNVLTVDIIARNKEDSLISINSKESGENAAVLNIIANGVKYSFPVLKELTIKGGQYKDTNFGFEDKLYSRDSGWPEDDDAARAYFLFEATGLDENSRISSAQLMVYGSTDSPTGTQDAMVFKCMQSTWEEGQKTWNNSGLYVYSWQHQFYEKYNWKHPDGMWSDWSVNTQRFWLLASLAEQYRNTRDEKYAEATIKYLTEYARTNGGGQLLLHGDDRDGGLLICMGMRGQDLPEILYRVLNSPHMTADAFCEIMKFIHDDMEFLYHTKVFEEIWTKDTNFGVEEIAAHLSLIEAFREFTGMERWIERIISRINYQLETAPEPIIMTDGAYIEASNSYAMAVYKLYLGYREIFEKLDIPVPDTYERQIKRLAYYFTNVTEPNNYISPYGDCPYTDYTENLKIIADEVGRAYDDEYLMYQGYEREKGKKPPHTSVAYPTGEIFLQRSGWDKQDLLLHANTRVGAVHCHNDELHINLYAYGSQLLTDNPTPNYTVSDTTNWIRLSKQGHSTIEIDGQGEGNMRDSKQADGTQVSNNLSDMFRGHSVEEASTYMTQHDRQIMFIKPAGFWIVSDLVGVPGGKNHTITQQWQVHRNSNVAFDESKTAKTSFVGEANLHIVPADPEKLTVSIEEGYYSDKFKTYPVYTQTIEGAGAVSYDTVLYPVRSNDRSASCSVERVDIGKETTDATALKVTYKSMIDSEQVGYYYNNTGYYYDEYLNTYTLIPVTPRPTCEASFDRFKTDAQTVYVESDADGNITLANLYDGTYLSSGMTDLISLPLNVSDFSVSVEDGVMDISSSIDDVRLLKGTKIKAPQVSEIKFNGNSVTAYYDGTYVEIGKTFAGAQTAEIGISAPDGQFNVSVTGTDLPEVTVPYNKITPVDATVKRLYDNDISTMWAADEPSYPKTVFFDLGETKTLEKMDIFWRIPTDSPAMGCYDYGISVSNDNRNYKEVYRADATSFLSTQAINEDARYVKITIYGNTLMEVAGIRDVSFYEYPENSRSLSNGWSTEFSIGSDDTTLSSTAKIVIPDAGAMNVALLDKGTITKYDTLTKLENAKKTMGENAVLAARDKDDLIIYSNLGGTFMLSNAEINLAKLPDSVVSAGNSGDEGSSGDSGSTNSGLGAGGTGTGNNYAGMGGSADTPGTVLPPVESNRFYDVAGHWAENEISQAFEKGLINGVSENEFEPERSITRAEFAAISIRALNVPVKEPSVGFNDVSKDDWYSGIVQAAVNAGLMKGYEDGSFRPDAVISRQEAAMVMSILMDKLLIDSENVINFNDETNIASWAKDAVSKVAGAGIFKGDEQGRFNPTSPLTRAETAAIMVRIVK